MSLLMMIFLVVHFPRFAVSHFRDWQDLEQHLIPFVCCCAHRMHVHVKLNTTMTSLKKQKMNLQSEMNSNQNMVGLKFFDLRFDLN